MKLPSRERAIRALNGEAVDRPPLFDILRNNHIIEHLSKKELIPGGGMEYVLEAINSALDCTKSFILFPQISRVLKTKELNIHIRDRYYPGFTHQVEEWNSWIISYPFKNTDEMVTIIQNEIKSYQWHSEERSSWEAYLNHIQKIQQAVPRTLICWHLAIDELLPYEFTGIENFIYLLADYPELIEEWLEIRLRKNLDRIKNIGNFPIKVVFWPEDIAYKSGTIFSPAFLRNSFFPRLTKVIDLLHERGIKVVFHSDGNLWKIMPDLVNAGIDALNPVEITSGMDPVSLREAYPKLVLVGGIDSNMLLTFGSPETIATETSRIIKGVGSGYLVGSSAVIHKDIPLENVLAMWEAAWNYRY